MILMIFGPVLKQETQYWSDRISGTKYSLTVDPNFPETRLKQILPVDENFGIVIPKINANARIFANIDPFGPQEFLPILKKGVAHALGTGFPGEGKNIYLFAHSTDAFYQVGNYNAVFYLIGKLEEGDEIDLYYQDNLYQYKVFEKMVVSPEAIEYLKPESEEILTLQTCYPPGTTLKRLVVRAKRSN